MYLIIEENPNCGPEERMFAASGAEREVIGVSLDRPTGGSGPCDVIGVDEGGTFVPARAVQVEDSAAGMAWLVTGGSWGLRLRAAGGSSWSLEDATQWGVPFLVMDQGEGGVRFLEKA